MFSCKSFLGTRIVHYQFFKYNPTSEEPKCFPGVFERMHEMSIAVELLQQLEAVAAEHGVQRIESFTVAAGAMRGVVPEALDIAFESVADGTAAQGADLKLEIVSALARCRQCGCEFEPGIDSYLCLRCNQADVEIVRGNEIVLMSVTGQQGNEGSGRNED